MTCDHFWRLWHSWRKWEPTVINYRDMGRLVGRGNGQVRACRRCGREQVRG